MRTVSLGLLQYQVTAIASVEEYAAKLDRLVAEGAGAGAELLVMPEYACMEVAAAFGQKEVSAHRELIAVCGQARHLLEAMRASAMRHRVWLLPGSLPWQDEAGVRNRAPLIAPDGTMAFQDKLVMTRFETEQWGVRPGAPPSVFATPWGRIGIAICYDVEFPDLVRAQVAAGAWLILVPSCTDTTHGFSRVRISAQARALENQAYVAVAPTVGEAPWLATLDSNHGHAAVFGPVDRGFPPDGVLAQGAMDMPQWLFATLDPARLEAVRADGAVRNHRDWPASVPAAQVATEEGVPA